MRKVVGLALAVCLAACADRPWQADRDLAPPAPSGPILPSGYAASPVASQLADPRALLFDRDGRPLVLEGQAARLSRIAGDGSITPIAQGGGNGPWSGAAQTGGRLFVAEAGGPQGGRILEVAPSGAVTPLPVTLPGAGLVGPLAAGPDGALYVGIASAAATGGRGDIPCQDITAKSGRRVEGAVPCTGAILRLNPDSGTVEIHSWGWSAPAALAFAADGRLLVAERVAQDSVLHQALAGVWYGWPDSQLAAADPATVELPNPPPSPLASIAGATGGLAATDRPGFGGPDEIFLSLIMPDGQGVVAFTGLDGGPPVPFAANLRRPQALAFSPAGDSLWVADAGTGTLWRIAPMAGGASANPARLSLPPPPPSGTSVANHWRPPAWKIRA